MSNQEVIKVVKEIEEIETIIVVAEEDMGEEEEAINSKTAIPTLDEAEEEVVAGAEEEAVGGMIQMISQLAEATREMIGIT
jgi:hypothetical protein